MTRSLYSKFILGYLIFGLLGFITIATFSSKMTRDYLVRYQADAMYDEANIIASSCSTMYQGKRMDSEEVTSQIRALSKYLRPEHTLYHVRHCICPLVNHPPGIYPDRLPAPAQDYRWSQRIRSRQPGVQD